MGGAVAISAADEPSAERVLGLAPWIPDRLSLEPLRGKRLDVLHGSLDRWLPGIPGVSPASSRRGFERARALGVAGHYELIPGALHGIALRARSGRPLPLPARRGLGAAGRRLSSTRSEARRRSRWRLVGNLHVPDEPEPLEPADDPPRDVELAAVEAVPRGRGEGVVVVVPALAEDEQRDEPVVAGLVA